jgi:photosystem II stability/assembly factor-like uncharacterized protein
MTIHQRRHSHWPTCVDHFGLPGLILAALIYCNSALAATDPDATMWITDGTVYTMVQRGGVVFLGGDFSYLGPNSGFSAEFPASGGSRSKVIPPIGGGSGVLAAAPDGNEGWYIAGSFNSVGSTARQHIVHIDKDGLVDSAFAPNPDGVVRALAFDSENKRLYVGGDFTRIGDRDRPYLAKIDTDTRAVMDWSASLDGPVHALTLTADATVLYVGGAFARVNGNSDAAGVVALAADGSLAPGWNPALHTAVGGPVRALQLDPTTAPPLLWIGGGFATLGGQSRNHLGAIAADSGALHDANPNADGEVFALGSDPDKHQLYVGGSFANVAGTAVNGLARMSTADADGNAIAAVTVDTTWMPQPNGTVSALALMRPSSRIPWSIFVGGEFTQISGEAHNFHAKLNRDNVKPDAGWNLITNGAVRTLAPASNGGNILLGGEFTTIGGSRVNKLGAVFTASGDPVGWAPQVDDGSVRSMTLSADGSLMYLGGDFSSVGGIARRGLARVGTKVSDPSTWLPDPWNPNIEAGAVTTMALATYGGNVWSVVFDPSNASILYAGTARGLYKSTDGGAQWSDISGTLGTPDVRAILVDPNAPQTVYIGTAGAGVAKSNDGGRTWTPYSDGIAHPYIQSFAILEDSSMLFVGTQGKSDATSGVFTRRPGDSSWQHHLTADVRAIAPDPQDASIIYLGVSDGVFRWDRSAPDASAFERVVINMTESSVASMVTSNDSFECNGKRYNKLFVGAGTLVEWLSGCEPRIDLATGRPQLDANGKTIDVPTWKDRVRGIPAFPVTSITIDPTNTRVLYAATAGAGIFRTDNGGEQWERKNDGINIPNVWSVGLSPNDTATLFAGTAMGFVYATTDGGARWQPSSRGIPQDILYVGGDFTGAHPNYIAALGTAAEDSGLFGTWNALSDGAVRAMRLSQDLDTLYVGGAFTSIGGAPRQRIAALNSADGSAQSWAPTVDDGAVRTFDVNSAATVMYLGGSFTRVNTRPRNRIAALSLADGTLQDWDPNSNGAVHVLKVTNDDSLVYVAGNFSEIGGAPRQNLASLYSDITSGNATAWTPDPDAAFPIGEGLIADSSTKDTIVLYVGGAFETISGRHTPHFAAYRFVAPRIKITPTVQAYNTPQSIVLACVKTAAATTEGATGPTEVEDTDCEHIYYSTDGATWQTFVKEIPLSVSTSLRYYAVRAEGIRNAVVTSSYIFDYTQPNVRTSEPSGKYPYTRVINLLCNDGDSADPSVSACEKSFYTTDGSDPTFRIDLDSNTGLRTYTATGESTRDYREYIPVSIDTELRFVSVDKAGNASAIGSEFYRIERAQGGANSPLTLAALALAALLVRRRYRARAV